MKGVLLVNMGSPDSEDEMKFFLKKMFMDKSIMPLPYILRKFVSSKIANNRFKKSWQKYEIIGGSPLISAMEIIKKNLSASLGANFMVKCAFSYSNPLINNALEDFKNMGIKNIIIIPAYPFNSISTTGSIVKDIKKYNKNNKYVNIDIINDYFFDEFFIKYWQNLVEITALKNNFLSPHLLFSAHSIPNYHIKKGDKYVDNIIAFAEKISRYTGYNYSVSFQSKIGKIKWAEPDTFSEIKNLKEKGIEELILVPVSFITENLETLYDLDNEIIPNALNEIKITNVARVIIPQSHELLIKTFKNIIFQNDKY